MKPRLYRIFPWPFYLLLVVVIGITGFFVYPFLAAPFAKKRFTTTWIHIFQEHPSKSELGKMPATYRPDCVFVRDFSDGSWVAARSECTHDNDMFDAAVFVDSSRAIHTSYHHFCGQEGLAEELSEPNAGNLREFYAELEAKKIYLHSIP